MSMVSKEMEKNEEHVMKISYVIQMEVASKLVLSRDHQEMDQVVEHAGRVNFVSVTVFVKVSNCINASKRVKILNMKYRFCYSQGPL